MRLENKIAVITGGRRGMGHAMTVRFATEGARGWSRKSTKTAPKLPSTRAAAVVYSPLPIWGSGSSPGASGLTEFATSINVFAKPRNTPAPFVYRGSELMGRLCIRRRAAHPTVSSSRGAGAT
jgi:NAD(P)-dependent dehydrogenase (short-subunit alcohol dehydrogenase family)